MHKLRCGFLLEKLYNKFKTLPSKSFNAGSIIYSENTPTNQVFLIEKGTIKVYHASDEGKIIFQYCFPGEIPGIYDIFRGENYTNTAEAVTDCVLFKISSTNFMKEVRSNPEIRVELMKSLCGGIENLEDKISCIKEYKAEKRFAEILNVLMLEFGTSPAGTINLKLTIDDIAALACMSRSYTKKVISEFITQGIISYSANKLKILNKKKLEEFNIKY